MTPPVMPELPYEQQLAQWGKKKIAAGVDPAIVTAIIHDHLHAHQEKQAAEPIDTGPETSGDRVAGIISAGYQGLTMGAGNKITAGLRSVFPEAIGGTKGFDYPTALKEQTQVLDDYRDHHPLESTAVELAGAAPTFMVGGGAGAGKSAGALERIGRGAAKGAAYGGVAGGMEAVRPDASVDDVESGAGLGAAAGAAIGGGIPAVGGLARMAKGASSGVVRDVAMSPVSNTAKARLLARLLTRAAPVAEDAADVAGPNGLTEADRQALIRLGVPADRIAAAKVAEPVSRGGMAPPPPRAPADASKVLQAVKGGQSEQASTSVLDAVKNGPSQPPPSLGSTDADRSRWRRAGGSPVIHEGGAEPSLEDLLRQSLDLIQKGGKLGKSPPIQ